MSRCIICDFCSTIEPGQHGKRSLEWNEKENGYVCSVCSGKIRELVYYDLSRDFDGRNIPGQPHELQWDTPDVPTIEDSDLGGPSVLEEFGLEVDATNSE